MMGLMQDWPLLVHTILDHAAWLGRARGGVANRRGTGSSLQLWRPRASCQDDCRCRRETSSASPAAMWSGRWHGTPTAMSRSGTGSWEWAPSCTRSIRGCLPTSSPISSTMPRTAGCSLDLTFVKLLEELSPRLPKVKGYVVMTDERHMPAASKLPQSPLLREPARRGRPGFRLAQARRAYGRGICYTSGTTGNPKGVVYSHRSTVLCAMMNCAGDALALASRDTVMPVVPMFHANAWSLIFAAPMAGAKLVMPGPKLDGASLYELIVGERVTFTAAVPTLWLRLLNFLKPNPALAVPDLERVRDRWLGLPGSDDARLHRAAWHRCHPCLGHDRDEPDRLDRTRRAAGSSSSMQRSNGN